MSRKALEQVIDKAWTDGEFFMRLVEWPQEIQEEYSLSDDEVDALRNANVDQLRKLGVDEGHLERVPRTEPPVEGEKGQVELDGD